MNFKSVIFYLIYFMKFFYRKCAKNSIFNFYIFSLASLNYIPLGFVFFFFLNKRDKNSSHRSAFWLSKIVLNWNKNYQQFLTQETKTTTKKHKWVIFFYWRVYIGSDYHFFFYLRYVEKGKKFRKKRDGPSTKKKLEGFPQKCVFLL